MERRLKVELFEEIRREYEFGVGTIKGVAQKLGVSGGGIGILLVVIGFYFWLSMWAHSLRTRTQPAKMDKFQVQAALLDDYWDAQDRYAPLVTTV